MVKGREEPTSVARQRVLDHEKFQGRIERARKSSGPCREVTFVQAQMTHAAPHRVAHLHNILCDPDAHVCPHADQHPISIFVCIRRTLDPHYCLKFRQLFGKQVAVVLVSSTLALVTAFSFQQRNFTHPFNTKSRNLGRLLTTVYTIKRVLLTNASEATCMLRRTRIRLHSSNQSHSNERFA